MTSDTEAKWLILEALDDARPWPVAPRWISGELARAGRPLRSSADLPELLDDLERQHLLARDDDPLGARRYKITDAGRQALLTYKAS
jgi:hypothetical protein